MYEQPEIWVGDCRELFCKIPKGCIDLLFCDPPFGIGQEYAGFNDNISEPEYCKFTAEWIKVATEALAEDGTICVHVPDKWVVLVCNLCNLNHLIRMDWIIWHYRFGQCTRSKFINSKAHCLVFAKNKDNRCWNPDAVLVESDRVKYGDSRTRYSQTPGRRVPLDVWGPGEGEGWGRVQGNNRERCPGHPNQLPEKYLERLILAYSDPNDLVCDPFTGSGTTGVVATALGRRFVGFEIAEVSAASARQRLTEGPVRVRSELCTS